MSSRRVKAVIDLKAAKQNVINLYEHMDNPVPILCVIKANGYGHGSLELAKVYEKMDQVCGYATATAEEALYLRNNNINKMILILGATFCEDYEELISNDVSLTVFDYDSAVLLSEAAVKVNKKAKVHIKIDTGMSRIGIRPDKEGVEIVKQIADLQNIELEGIFTHFARADEIDKYCANEQYDKFSDMIDLCNNEKLDFKIRHCSNSAALLEMPYARYDMVRAGIVLYGLWPSNEIVKENIELNPVMSIESHIVYIKEILPGTAISYGGTFVAEKVMRVATIPVGYADGYPRMLSNKGYVLIRGQKAPILGRVCMDQMMVDVSKIEGVSVYDKVTLMGKDGNLQITAEDLGDMSGRFNYELVCDITSRVPREYV